jgi:hypothetical protein
VWSTDSHVCVCVCVCVYVGGGGWRILENNHDDRIMNYIDIEIACSSINLVAVEIDI